MANKFRTITRQDSLRDALARIDRSSQGVVLLVDAHGRFLRTVTDGDIRRLLLAGQQIDDKADVLPEVSSHIADENDPPRKLLSILNEHRIEQIPLLDDEGKPVAVVHRRDIHDPILLSSPHLGEDEFTFVREAFDTNWIAPLGPNVDNFEKEIAEYVDVRSACALSSGTAAIHLGLVLLGVGPGDIVFVSDLTFVASANPVLYQNATPVFIDSEPSSWNMSPLALERAFEDAKHNNAMPKAVVVVSLYGQSADIDPLLEICERYGVPLLEDAAESLGAKYKDKYSGTLGKMGFYSFNGNKIITTSGGGMLVSDDEELVTRARYLATQARQPVPHYEHTETGFNYRMSNILAGVGRGQLRVLDERIRRRREINEIYRKGLFGIEGIEWMPEPDWSFSNRWLSAITLDKNCIGKTAMQLVSELNNHFIEARNIWKPMHMQPLFEGAKSFSHGNSSCSADIFERGMCLPSGSNMSDEQVQKVIDTIKKLVA